MFNIVSLFVSIIIGAGFASGKELFSFFATQEKGVFYVILPSIIVFFPSTYATLELIRICKTKNYTNFLNIIFKNSNIISFFEICIIFFMFVSFSSMLAGFTSLTSLAFNFNKTYARLFFVILNFTFLLKGHKYLLKLSNFLVPTLVIGALVFGFSYLISPTKPFLDYFININFSLSALGNGLTYSSYNLITAVAIVSTLPELCKNKKQNLFASIFISLTLLILTISILIPLFSNYNLIKTTDMPIYTILESNSATFVLPYVILMIFATLSTSVANAYGVTIYLCNKYKSNYFLNALLVIFSGVVFSLIGFSNIVNFVYPIFGFFGIIKIVKILVTFFIIKPEDKCKKTKKQ